MREQLDQEWVKVIETVAGYVAMGHEESDIFETYIRSALLAEGYSLNSVKEAFICLEQASLTGTLTEVLSMMHPAPEGARVSSPLEEVCVSDRLWKQIQSLRCRGILASDVVERLIEGIRSLDTRDWEDEEITDLVTELMAYSLPNATNKQLKKLLRGKTIDYYC